MKQTELQKVLTAPIFYITNDPERALGLETRLPNFHIVCTDHNPTVDALLLDNRKVFSLAGELGQEKPIFRNSNKLLQHSATQEYIRRHTIDGIKPNIIVFKVAPNIEKTCQKMGYNLLNTSADLNRIFENKITQFTELSKVDVRFPKTIIGRFNELNWNDLVAELGPNLVIQFNRGHTGLGTNFINSEDEFSELAQKFPNREVRVAKKIDGEAWTINAAVTRYGVAYSGLSYQITGLPGITEQEGGTVGNDWSKVNLLSEEVKSQIQSETEKIGNAMEEHGYKGLFGIDFIITSDNQLYVIEVNARQPASTGMHTKLMLRENQIPIMLLHLAEFLFEDKDAMYEEYVESLIGYPPTRDNIKTQNEEGLQSIHASQIIARKLQGDKSRYSNIKAGIYHHGEWKMRGYNIDDISNNGNLLVLRQFNEDLIKPGYEISRFQALMPYEELLKEVDSIIDVKTS